MMWYDMIYDMKWYDMVWYYMIYDMKYDMVWYDIWYTKRFWDVCVQNSKYGTGRLLHRSDPILPDTVKYLLWYSIWTRTNTPEVKLVRPASVVTSRCSCNTHCPTATQRRPVQLTVTRQVDPACCSYPRLLQAPFIYTFAPLQVLHGRPGTIFTAEDHTSPPSECKTPSVVRSGSNVAKLVWNCLLNVLSTRRNFRQLSVVSTLSSCVLLTNNPTVNSVISHMTVPCWCLLLPVFSKR